MYLHVGNNRNLRVRDIVGIFDADTATVSPVTKKFLANAQEKGAVEFASVELPKAFVVHCEHHRFKPEKPFWKTKPNQKKKPEFKICFSQLSPASLAGRAENQL